MTNGNFKDLIMSSKVDIQKGERKNEIKQKQQQKNTGGEAENKKKEREKGKIE